jgi:hypothetical protein
MSSRRDLPRCPLDGLAQVVFGDVRDKLAHCPQHLASVLQEGRENANIDAGLGFIWRISV